MEKRSEKCKEIENFSFKIKEKKKVVVQFRPIKLVIRAYCQEWDGK